jgi:hypothetical protein
LSDHQVQITRLGVELARDLATDELFLREGAEVVVRVLQAPPGGGRGLISLAGRRIAAQLPPGLAEGQRLQVTVEARGADQLLLRIVTGGEPASVVDHAGRLAAALALTGEADLLRVALALSGGAVLLPGGGAAAMEVDPEGASPGREDGQPAHARLTLHSPELGPIEIALALTPTSISAAVIVEPGRACELAQGARPELVEALERAAACPAGASVVSRAPTERRPAPPIPVDGVDVRA